MVAGFWCGEAGDSLSVPCLSSALSALPASPPGLPEISQSELPAGGCSKLREKPYKSAYKLESAANKCYSDYAVFLYR